MKQAYIPCPLAYPVGSRNRPSIWRCNYQHSHLMLLPPSRAVKASLSHCLAQHYPEATRPHAGTLPYVKTPSNSAHSNIGKPLSAVRDAPQATTIKYFSCSSLICLGGFIGLLASNPHSIMMLVRGRRLPPLAPVDTIITTTAAAAATATLERCRD